MIEECNCDICTRAREIKFKARTNRSNNMKRIIALGRNK